MSRVSPLKTKRYAIEYYRNGGNQMKAFAAVGGSDPKANASRFHHHPATQAALSEVEADHREAMRRAGLTSDVWAEGLKKGVEEAQPAALRLYAEVVKLVGDDAADQVMVIVQTTIQQGILPVILDVVPREYHGRLLASFQEKLKEYTHCTPQPAGSSLQQA